MCHEDASWKQLDAGTSARGRDSAQPSAPREFLHTPEAPRDGDSGNDNNCFAKILQVPTVIKPQVFREQESSLCFAHPAPLHTVPPYKCPFIPAKSQDCKMVLEKKGGGRIHLSVYTAVGRARQNCLTLWR